MQWLASCEGMIKSAGFKLLSEVFVFCSSYNVFTASSWEETLRIWLKYGSFFISAEVGDWKLALKCFWATFEIDYPQWRKGCSHCEGPKKTPPKKHQQIALTSVSYLFHCVNSVSNDRNSERREINTAPEWLLRNRDLISAKTRGWHCSFTDRKGCWLGVCCWHATWNVLFCFLGQTYCCC